MKLVIELTNKPMKVYILLSDTGTYLTSAIKRYTKVPYNHVSLSLNRDLIELYSFGRKFTHNPFIGGFVVEKTNSGIYAHFPNTTCIIYELDVDVKTYENIEKAINKFKRRSYFYTYNIFGLIGVPMNIPVEVKFAYFCSQFVAEVLYKSGVNLFNKRSSLVTPSDFYKHKELKVVFEGRLSKYSLVNKKH